MPVSERDREFMRRIGEYKTASHADALAEHRQHSIADRLRLSWEFYLRHRSAAPTGFGDDPTAFYDRARALGLYRG